MAKMFQEAQESLMSVARVGASPLGSPVPKLSTSKARNRRSVAAQHAVPSLRRENAVSRTPESWRCPTSQLASPSRRSISIDHMSTTSANVDRALCEASRIEEIPHSPPTGPAVHEDTVAPIGGTIVKSKVQGESPQLPIPQPIGDLFDDVAEVLDPLRGPTPLCSVPPLARTFNALSQPDQAPHSPTGTWSDDEIFYPGPTKQNVSSRLPLSHTWSDDSQFYCSPCGQRTKSVHLEPADPAIECHDINGPDVKSPPFPVANNEPTSNSVLNWLNDVSPTSGEPYSPRDALPISLPSKLCDITPAALMNQVRQVEVHGSPELQPMTTTPGGTSNHSRGNSTRSSPPRVKAVESPPLSPLSDDVEIYRGSLRRRMREYSRTASYYDDDIFREQRYRMQEERRMARLEQYDY
ncbi:MAG: hypothetical protein M1820_003686 [Bogoriella megaspora]|nr:MAG: hypothetical protein M1820_003686 [Bogoriella megaspora]